MKRILFIEDNPKAQEAIREVFGRTYQVEIAEDYVSAISKFETQPDFIVTDVFFPQEVGTGKRDFAESISKELLQKYWQIFLQRMSYERRRRSRQFFPEFYEQPLIRGWNDFIFGTLARETEWKTYLRAKKGLEEWLSDPDEAEQPLGYLIAQECKKRNIPFAMATSLDHHNRKVEAVFGASKIQGWQFFDGKSGQLKKENKNYWKELEEVITNSSR